MLKVYILVLPFLCVFSKIDCPASVNDELELASLRPQCFRQLYNSQVHDGHKLSRILNDRITNYKRILQDIKMNDVQHLKTHPVIKWAQSQSQIFLNLRLSHRHDSPTCSDIRFQKLTTNVKETQSDINFDINPSENQNEEKHSQNQPDQRIADQQNNNIVSEPSTFMFLSIFLIIAGECFFTHQKLLFSLNITFNSTLSKLTVKRQGFGRYTVIGDKQQSKIWINPFTGWKDAGIWADMRNKYSQDMDKYFQLLEESSEKKVSKGKRRSKSKKDKATQEL